MRSCRQEIPAPCSPPPHRRACAPRSPPLYAAPVPTVATATMLLDVAQGVVVATLRNRRRSHRGDCRQRMHSPRLRCRTRWLITPAARAAKVRRRPDSARPLRQRWAGGAGLPRIRSEVSLPTMIAAGIAGTASAAIDASIRRPCGTCARAQLVTPRAGRPGAHRGKHAPGYAIQFLDLRLETCGPAPARPRWAKLRLAASFRTSWKP